MSYIRHKSPQITASGVRSVPIKPLVFTHSRLHPKEPDMTKLTREQQIAAIEKDWAENPRWKGIKLGYTAADVVRLRGSLKIERNFCFRSSRENGLFSTSQFLNASGSPTRP